MSSKNTNTAKKVNSKNENLQTEKKESLIKINLSKFSEVLENKNFNKAIANVKQGIYIYYENENIQSNPRDKFRKVIAKYCDNILLSAKNLSINPTTENENILIENIKVFNGYYKYRYLLNDFSVESVTNSQKDIKRNDLKMMFEIIKENNLQSEIIEYIAK